MSYNETNFFKIWRNQYLNKILFRFLELYKLNRDVEFRSILDIRNYEHIEYVTKLVYWGNEIFEYGDLPLSGTLKYIKFYSHFKMDNSVIPNSVTSIHYPGSYCDCCTGSYMKNSISSLSIDPKSITTIINPFIEIKQIGIASFSSTLEHIHFNSFYNGSISGGVLPRKLKTLIFGELWRNNDETLKINDLPNSLTELNLGGYIQVLKVGIIPTTVINLTMNSNPIYGIPSNVIPPSVTHLSITYDHKKVYTNQYLSGGYKTPSLLDSFKMDNILDSMGSLLSNVTYSISIPSTVTSLELGRYYHSKLVKGMISSTIKSLNISCSEKEFSIDQDALSSTCLTSFIVQYWNPPTIKAGFFPSTLTYLNLGHAFSHPLIEDLLPTGLKLLKYGVEPQQSIENNSNTVIPKGTKVEINYFNHYKKLY